jgi:glycerol kinase
VEAMAQDARVPLQELRVDGGAARNNLLMQMQADLLGLPVTRPANPETTVLGAAFLAGLAVKYWPDQEAIRRHWKTDRRFEPQIDQRKRRERYQGWRRALDRARAWAES